MRYYQAIKLRNARSSLVKKIPTAISHPCARILYVLTSKLSMEIASILLNVQDSAKKQLSLLLLLPAFALLMLPAPSALTLLTLTVNVRQKNNAKIKILNMHYFARITQHSFRSCAFTYPIAKICNQGRSVFFF